MRTSRGRTAVAVAVLSATMGGVWRSAPAATAATTTISTDHTVSYVPARYVSTRMLAWALDPAHNPTPQEFAGERGESVLQNPLVVFGLTPGKLQTLLGQRMLKLPAGIDSVVANAPQNYLMVTGTPDGMRELQRILDVVDRPVQQVEIETQVVEIGSADLKTLSLEFMGPAGEGATPVQAGQPRTVATGIAKGNYRPVLDRLVAQGVATVTTRPRVTVVSGVMRRLVTSVTTPVTLDMHVEGKPLLSGPFDLVQEVGVEAAPTVNDDDTITMRMTTLSSTVLKGKDATELLFSSRMVNGAPLTSLNAVFVVKDGATIALAGFPTALPHLDPARPDRQVVMLVTPRIVRRTDYPAVLKPISAVKP